MKLRIILLLIVVAFLSFTIGNTHASPPVTFNSTASVTMTLGTSTVDQATADAQRAAVLLDYCKARGLDQSSPAASVSADVKAIVKAIVVDYRAQTAAATQRTVDAAAIQP